MTPTLPVNPPPRRLSGARIATLVAAGVLAVCSIGFVAAGALLLWGDSRHDEQGYINSDRERLQTRTSALVTENLDLDLDGADRLIGSDAFGKVRLQVEAAAGEPVFVGIAPTSRVEDYLRDAAHDVVTDVDLAPFHIAHRTHDGSARPAAPVAQRFWAASAQGAGTQTLDWDVEDGDWSVVVMNADGSAGVSAGVRAGVGLPWLAPAGWGALGGGMLLLVAAAGMTFLALRTPVR